MYILGISAFYHDSAAAIIKNGEVIAAAQEERFTRIKHDAKFPENAINYCLNEAKITGEELTNIVFYEKPFLKFERLLETYLAFAPRGFLSFSKAIPTWIKNKLFQKSILINQLKKIFNDPKDIENKLLFSGHHLSHASSAFFPSPFKSAAVLTLDGVGEWATTSVSLGKKNKLKVLKEINFPHSLGLLYSAFTYHAGFKVNSAEYKVMGLAPYGEPIYVDIIKKNLIKIYDDGSFQLNMKYFNFATGLTMTNKKFNTLFGGEPRKPEMSLTKKEMDLAASIQKVTEEIIIKIVKNIEKETGEKNLCLAGGVALNCVANGDLLRKKIFKNIWIQPASGDAGGALGAALAVWYLHYNKERFVEIDKDNMKGSYLGPSFDDKEIIDQLKSCGASYNKLNKTDLLNKTSLLLSEGKAIGWMQGRMEFGPRALGCRSIIADPRSPKMQKQLNLKIKFRESFRPFAPSILFEHIDNWFEDKLESPYMLITSNLKKDKRITNFELDKSLAGLEKLKLKRSEIPAVTHVDYSSRIQTVHKKTNPLYHELITKFYEDTGCPILVNTSFNVRGEPIVCTPTDSFNCFMGTDLDALVVGNYLLLKEDQNEKLKKNYQNKFLLD